MLEVILFATLMASMLMLVAHAIEEPVAMVMVRRNPREVLNDRDS